MLGKNHYVGIDNAVDSLYGHLKRYRHGGAVF